MAENEDKKPKQESNENPAGTVDLMTSVTMAFNMGVAANQSTGHTRSVAEIAPELGQQIYQNLEQAYGGQYREEFLMANTEYFLQIALLGFIIPTVCAFEPDFKDRLFALIQAKAQQDQEKAGSKIETPPSGGNIIVP